MAVTLRCVVNSWDHQYIYATVPAGLPSASLSATVPAGLPSEPLNASIYIDITDAALPAILTPHMQLNLLDCTIDGCHVSPTLIIVEPDFLIDISAIAACFQDYGCHPANYLLNQLKPRANSQAILLGNFAGTALDDLINHPEYPFADTLRSSFREQALQFCTCTDFDAQRFKADCQQQVANIRQAVDVLFHQEEKEETRYHRKQALVEPSFVCEKLGLQGRVDLMTDDMRLLVEQKSGKNWLLEKNFTRPYKEAHYVQLLLYYGVLHYNFQTSADQTDIRLLYSRYPAHVGLLAVNYSQPLFYEAISLRNKIVAQQMDIANKGFSTQLRQLTPERLLQKPQRQAFFERFIVPQLEKLLQPFHLLDEQEREYVERMMTFIYREQLAQKSRMYPAQDNAVADLWNMSLEEKMETGSITMGSVAWKEPDRVALIIDTTTIAPNFRRGDMVYLYAYHTTPDVRASILYKGTIEELTNCEAVVRLSNRQQNPTIFCEGTYAIEHASSDIGIASAVRSIYAFCTAQKQKRDLLLGRRPPRRNSTLQLSHSYHQHYDHILLQAKQAQDYYLLQGPPGTGKTSMALRFLVEEALAEQPSAATTQLLLTAYTNRAVDEICGMLESTAIDYLRLGNRASCEPRYIPHLLDEALGDKPRLEDIRQRISDCHVIVATTSILQSRPFLFQLKHFSLCIVDEASQILEPSIIGLLASDSIDRFILIGDHKQLPAVVQQPDDDELLRPCRLSLFERLLRHEEEAGRTDFMGLLQHQGRMHPDIAQFPNEFFYRKEQLLCVPLTHQEEERLHYPLPPEDALDELLQNHRVLFLPSDDSTKDASKDSSKAVATGKTNPKEARIVADLLRRIVRQYGKRFDPLQSVGVIVPYRNQIAMIRHELSKLNLPVLKDVSIDTVERYQGSQRDVIIYAFTVHDDYQLRFITATCYEEDGHTIDRKLNVAMTRARCQLLMTGNTAVLSKVSLFAELIRRYRPATGFESLS